MLLLGCCREGNIVPKFQLFNKLVLTVECVIPSPMKGNQTFLGITGVPFFRIELKPIRRVSAYDNLKIFQHRCTLHIT